MARFVKVEHPALGRTQVLATRVRHLGPEWSVVDDDAPAPEAVTADDAADAEPAPDGTPAVDDAPTEDNT